MKEEKEKIGKHFNPDKFKMVCCPSCKGTGKSSVGDKDGKVCWQCGGFGWVKKES